MKVEITGVDSGEVFKKHIMYFNKIASLRSANLLFIFIVMTAPNLLDFFGCFPVDAILNVSANTII